MSYRMQITGTVFLRKYSTWREAIDAALSCTAVSGSRTIVRLHKDKTGWGVWANHSDKVVM